MTKERKIVYACVLALVAALFVLGGLFDLSLSDAIYEPDNFMARVFESVGCFPPFVIIAATFTVLFFDLDERKSALLLKKLVCVACVIGDYLVFGFVASGTYLEKLLFRALVGLGAAAVLTPLTFLALRNVGEDKRKSLLLVLIFGSIVSVISTLLSCNVLKYIWGRPRYREMVKAGDTSFTAFTNWFHINGFSLHGNHSFPSAHTSAASNLFVFCAVTEVFPYGKSRERRIAFIAALYTFIMAYSRVVIGAHFLSDVTAGFFIGFLTYAVARYFFFRRFGAAVNSEVEIIANESKEGPWDDPSLAEPPVREEIDLSSDDSEISEILTVKEETVIDETEEREEVLIEEIGSDSVTILLSEEDHKEEE